MPTIGPYIRRLIQHVQPLIVSNRAPLSLVPADPIRGEREQLVRGSGGLVSAMLTLANATHAIWIAAARNERDRILASRAEPDGTATLRADDGTQYRVGFVDIEHEAYDMYYNVISNPLLWFIHHYLWDLAREPLIDASIHRAWNDGYELVNRKFAERVILEAKRSDYPPLILFQDYQLYCAPRIVRQAIPNATMQHFIHVPWPTPQYWKILPSSMRNSILHGLLGNDIIGFQTRRDVRNFLLTCEENLALEVDHRDQTVFYEGRAVWARSYPISVDPREFQIMAEHPSVATQEKEILTWRPKHLILRVDRTDLSKNIIRGFLAYERMLEQHPEYIGNTVFWAFLQESRQDIGDYRAYLGNVVGLAARINHRFRERNWMPIKLEIDNDIYRALAGYKQFDVLLVNPIYDGMNLVAKEGMLCNEPNGVLVLSENAGSHDELGQYALSINPFDIDETADALFRALTMERGERKRRADGIRRTVHANDITRWIARQLQDIRELTPQ